MTRFCTVGCKFCFFNSAPPYRKNNPDDEFNDQGIDYFLSFAQKSNLGYLLISGGGEPMNKREQILKIVEQVKSDRIVLVTSGNWARNYEIAYKYIDSIHKAIEKNIYNPKVVIRVSISDYHAVKLGTGCAENIVKVFDKFYHSSNRLLLQIKSLHKDKALRQFLQNLGGSIVSNSTEHLVSDNDVIEKIIPIKKTIRMPTGYQFILGVSEIFDSSIKPNINDKQNLDNIIDTIENDLRYSEQHNSGIVCNKDGTYGLDWSISYNGNICIWQNQAPDHYKNIYMHSYEEVYSSYFNDPLTYSLLDKGQYRDKIVSEVNPLAVFRAKYGIKRYYRNNHI